MASKIDLLPEQLQMIEKLFAVGFGARYIATFLNISRWMVQKGCKQLKLETASRTSPKKQIPQEQECKICQEIKKIINFANDKKHFTFKKKYCLNCLEKYGVKLCERSLRNNWHLVEIKAHLDDKKNIKYQSSKRWRKQKIKSDINFKLRSRVSSSINCYLKKSSASKENQSVIYFLPYSIKDLKNHLESQFEPWMNWQNWGIYKPNSWNDNDPTSWTWQIDHIIPHSTFKYQSMTDILFKECWSLKNLRPLSSKKNILEVCRKK
jgi:hypothetical protein